MNEIRDVLVKYIEVIAHNNQYDFIHEADDNGNVVGHIIFRDHEGANIATLLTLEILVKSNEKCEIVHYHKKGELKREDVSLSKDTGIIEFLNKIQERLNANH